MTSHAAAFRHAEGEVNRLPCIFHRALLARYAVCELAVGRGDAGGEGLACAQPVARVLCAQLSALLREKSAFVLGHKAARRVLPPATLMKIQCGGLAGLKAVLDADAVAPDVRRLVRLAQERYGGLDALPFSAIVQGVAAWKAYPRHSAKLR